MRPKYNTTKTLGGSRENLAATQCDCSSGTGLTITVQFSGALGIVLCLLENPQPQWDKEQSH